MGAEAQADALVALTAELDCSDRKRRKLQRLPRKSHRAVRRLRRKAVRLERKLAELQELGGRSVPGACARRCVSKVSTKGVGRRASPEECCKPVHGI